MLLPDNIHPEHSIYYNASFVLRTIQSRARASMLDLYVATRELRGMSMPTFVLCLDWLFLINLVKMTDDGQIELCT